MMPLRRHCEPFDAACGVAQDKLLLRNCSSRAAFEARWIAASLCSSQ
jgi:hypothetical protein